jgi:hypothetical protein
MRGAAEEPQPNSETLCIERCPMSRLPLLLLLLPAIGCSDEPAAPVISSPLTPQFTAGSGVIRNLLAQSTFNIGKIKRTTGNWEVELEAKPGLEIAVRRHDYPAGSHTGWHSHPGPVLIQVTEGTVTFYEANDPDCSPIRVGPGELLKSYVDLGEHAHIGRNETGALAVDYTVLLGPPGITVAGFRIDQPAPPEGQCPFSN